MLNLRNPCAAVAAAVIVVLALAPVALPRADAATPRCAGREATIVGTADAERIRGTSGADVIVALGGDDKIDGYGGNDVVCAGGGRDSLRGGPGADRLSGGGGDDLIYSGSGRGRASGDAGDDMIIGGAGDDLLEGGTGVDHCSGGGGADTCDGGSPGPIEPTPTDLDTCATDVENLVSCRTEGLPRRWKATFTGTTNYSTDPDSYYELASWSFSTTLVATTEIADTVVYVDEGGTGTFSVQGLSGECTINASGDLGETDFHVGLFMNAGDLVYDWDWFVTKTAPSLWRCPGEELEQSTTVDAGEQVEQLEFDREHLDQIAGHRVVTDEFHRTEYSWTLTPLE